MCNRKQLLNGLNKLSLSLVPQQTDSILLYCRELQKWSGRINLIARNTSATDIVEKHFLDSLTLLPLIQQGNDSRGKFGISLLDIGTGAGFPGLVLATALPELSVTLVEPRQKRVSFLRHIIRILALKNVQIIDQRIEAGQTWERPEYSFITSRAVAARDVFLPMITGIATANTVVIMMSAGDEKSEFGQERRSTHQSIAGWECLEEQRFSLPFSHDPRTLTLFRKIG